jgi:hypothetical protein
MDWLFRRADAAIWSTFLAWLAFAFGVTLGVWAGSVGP